MSASQFPSPERPVEANAPNIGGLPAVEAPTGAFILQLFVIPLLIVGCIFSVWFAFSWLAHMGSSPEELVESVVRMNDESWRQAHTLAQLLKNPAYDSLKDDAALAGKLADALKEQTATGGGSEKSLKLRIFLCLALGEFRVVDGLPALLESAKTQRTPEEIAVRRAAIESLSSLAQNAGVEKTLANSEVLRVVTEATARVDAAPGHEKEHDGLRCTATYALGILGGEESLNRLAQLVNDVSPNVRFNAATGMARYGDERCRETLLEMLDPVGSLATQSESDSTRIWKHALVVGNGMKGVEQLARKNPKADVAALRTAIEGLPDALPAAREYDRLRIDARETVLRLKELQKS